MPVATTDERTDQAAGDRPAPPPLKPLDFLDIDALLTDEERMVRDTVREFVVDRVLPGIGDWFERGEFPREVAAGLGELGLLGMHLKGYGCAGMNPTSYGIACMELEARRQRVPVVHLRPGVARDVPHLEVRIGGAEAASGCRAWRPARCWAASG